MIERVLDMFICGFIVTEVKLCVGYLSLLCSAGNPVDWNGPSTVEEEG